MKRPTALKLSRRCSEESFRERRIQLPRSEQARYVVSFASGGGRPWEPTATHRFCGPRRRDLGNHGTGKPGALVDIVSEGKSEECASRTGGAKFPKPNQDFPGYVIFPFQGTTQDPEIKSSERRDLQSTPCLPRGGPERCGNCTLGLLQLRRTRSQNMRRAAAHFSARISPQRPRRLEKPSRNTAGITPGASMAGTFTASNKRQWKFKCNIGLETKHSNAANLPAGKRYRQKSR